MKACICLAGWHFGQETYESLARVPDIDLYVLSHRPADKAPAWLAQLLPEGRFLSEPNVGYDWGAYQQFLERGIHRGYETIFFMHDDVHLLDPLLFAAAQDRLAAFNGMAVTGNGRNSLERNTVCTHVHSYAHSVWKPPTWDFEHDTVRGSFLATTRRALEKIGCLEVFWDRRGWLGVGSGNWSLRATSGRMQASLGPEAIQFLAETYLSSPYLLELVRGEGQHPHQAPPLSWQVYNRAVVLLARWLMTRYLNAPTPERQRVWQRRMQATIARL